MVLFPIALLWLIAVIVWVVRNEGSPGLTGRDWRRWVPRPPRRPSDAEGRGRRAAGLSRRRGARSAAATRTTRRR